jgi:hypothetical protein
MNKISNETEQLLETIVELQKIPSHHKEDIQKCVEKHSNMLLNYSYDSILDTIKGQLTDFRKSQLEVLRELLGDCKRIGIEKAFEKYDYQRTNVWLAVMHLVHNHIELMDKKEFLESYTYVLCELAPVMILETIGDFKQYLETNSLEHATSGTLAVILSQFKDGEIDNLTKVHQIIKDYEFNLGIIIGCMVEGIDSFFSSIGVD